MLAAPALAGYPVKPSAGEVVTTPRPAFLVYLDADETEPLVQVSAQASRGATFATCIPATPFSEPGKFSCQLAFDLSPGAYSWVFSYSKGGVRHATQPIPFTVAAPQPTRASATFTASTRTPKLDQSVVFTAASPGYARYVWSFGDGDTAVGRRVTHAYGWLGTYRVTLTVTTSDGVIARSSTTVRVAARKTTASPALPNTDSFPTIAGPSARSRKDPVYTRVASRLVKAQRSVFCWNNRDWERVVGRPVGHYVLGYVHGTRPRQVNLSPRVCAQLDLIRYRRPRPAANASIAKGVEALAHEVVHTVGVINEALTECYAIQKVARTARLLGASPTYARTLARIVGRNYRRDSLPFGYWTPLCRNGGPLDLNPKSPVWP